MKKKLIAVALGLICFGGVALASDSFDANVRKDLKDKMVDCDDRFQPIMTPTSQHTDYVILYNRLDGKVYKAQLVELEQGDE